MHLYFRYDSFFKESGFYSKRKFADAFQDGYYGRVEKEPDPESDGYYGNHKGENKDDEKVKIKI
jgi:hypothetical protein